MGTWPFSLVRLPVILTLLVILALSGHPPTTAQARAMPVPVAVLAVSAGTVGRALSRLDPVALIEGRA